MAPVTIDVEFAKFLESIATKAKLTKNSYSSSYRKLAALTEQPISETSQAKLIEIVTGFTNYHTTHALITVAIKIRKLYELSVTELVKAQEANQSNLVKTVKEKKIVAAEVLPTYKDLLDYLEYLWANNRYSDYIINYLLIHLQTRNSDLIFEFTTSFRVAEKDQSKNYIWIADRKVVFIRNNYKTAAKYLQKIHTILDKPFRQCVMKLMQEQEVKGITGSMIQNPDNVGYFVQKATLNSIGEGAYMKIVTREFRNDFNKIQEISNNRGTSIATIAKYYDVDAPE